MAGGSLLPQPVQMCSYRSILYFCGALNYFLALVKLGFVPIAGVSVIVNGFVDAKGSVGTTMSGLQLFYVRRSRTTHQDRQSRLARHIVFFSFLVKTRSSIHILRLPSCGPHC